MSIKEPDSPSIFDLPEIEIKTESEIILEKMTLEEKIGQLFIVRPESLHQDQTNIGTVEIDEEMKETIKTYPVGGVVLFSENIVSPEQLTTFIKSLQLESQIPLFMGIDEEGGRVSRIAQSPNFEVPQFKSMGNIGETNDDDNARNVGLVIGSYLKDYGFNLNFAPVADINTNPDNIVIGNRSFGSDPELVSRMVLAEIKGLHEAKIMSCTKHFPGHGNTKGDTHEGYVSIDKTWAELEDQELIPFIHSLDLTDMVMISHITTPNITSDQMPASLSKEMIEGKLRKELGYKGVIISDAMEMEAVAKEYTSSQIAVKGILAGLDLILMPKDFVEAFNSIKMAVEEGMISEARIDESVLRILELKERFNLLSR
ncbi:MAG: glycoside hydrolase family 3 protein [Clostridium sp.]|nr:glycoside hydrolase family 3 protein [Clostridium sp.]